MAVTSSATTPFLSVALSSATIAFFAMNSVSFMNARSLPPAFTGRVAENRLGLRPAATDADWPGLAPESVLEADELAFRLFQRNVERAGGRLLLGVDDQDGMPGRVQD